MIMNNYIKAELLNSEVKETLSVPLADGVFAGMAKIDGEYKTVSIDFDTSIFSMEQAEKYLTENKKSGFKLIEGYSEVPVSFARSEKMNEKSNIAKSILVDPWLIREESMAALKSILSVDDISAVQAVEGNGYQDRDNVSVRGNVGILNVKGYIFRNDNWLVRFGYGVSIESLAKDFNSLINNDSISSIILNIDSPGGEANGVSEFSDMVFSARDKKNIVSYVGGSGASGAYWIASSASKIYANDTAIIGSIGTVISVIDDRGYYEKFGIKEYELVSRLSPFKRDDVATTEGRDRVIDLLDGITEVFQSKVAAYRNVSNDVVKENYGKGKVFTGQKAQSLGMVDEVSSFEAVLNGLSDNYNEGEIAMSDENQIETKIEINLETIKSNYPDIAAALIAEGVEAEKARIVAINEASMPGYEDLQNKAISEGLTVEGFALEVVKAEKKAKENLIAATAADAGELPEITTATETQSDEIETIAAMVDGAGGKE